MKVIEAMTPDAHIANPNDAVQAAAQMMAQHDIGFLPVGENDRLVGMLTDRDIAVRAVAIGLPASTPVRDVMTRDVKYCYDDDDLDDAIENMGDLKVRRLPVVNRDKRLVGVLSIGDAARERRAKPVGAAMGDIAQPGGAHSQHPVA